MALPTLQIPAANRTKFGETLCPFQVERVTVRNERYGHSFNLDTFTCEEEKQVADGYCEQLKSKICFNRPRDSTRREECVEDVNSACVFIKNNLREAAGVPRRS
jgi:hypothetical protein